MPRGATCSLTSKAITIVGGSTQRSAISPQSRQTAKPHNLVSTFPGEGHFPAFRAGDHRTHRDHENVDQLVIAPARHPWIGEPIEARRQIFNHADRLPSPWTGN